MRVLFLTVEFSLPADNGHRMRTWSLLKAFASQGHKTTLLGFRRAPDDGGRLRERLRGICDAEMVPFTWANLSASADLLGRLGGLASPLPYAVGRFSSPAMRDVISRHLRRGRFDAVVCDVFSGVNLPETTPPVLLNHENVEHLILRRYLAFEKNPAKRFYAGIEYTKMRRWERHVCQRAALGMACSEADRSALSSLWPSLLTVVVPNVIDVDRYVPAAQEDHFTVLFQGGMDWYPNRDAVQFFVSHILPDLHARVPDVRFVVAGRHPSARFLHRFRHVERVSFTGAVADMRPVTASATVSVVPIRIGSGTRLKILEAGAMAKPIVSTRIGAEGLRFTDGQEIILADEPDAIATAIVDLLRDPARRRRVGDAARRRVEQDYSFPMLQTALHHALLATRLPTHP